MKKILLLVLIGFYSFNTHAQSEPFKGANTLVVISDSDNPFDELMKTIIQNGFEVKDSNEKYQTVSTDWKRLNDLGSYRIIASVNNNKIQLQGRWKNDVANGVILNGGDYEFEMVWKKSGGDAKMWVYLDSFASNFGTQKEYYLK